MEARKAVVYRCSKTKKKILKIVKKNAKIFGRC